MSETGKRKKIRPVLKVGVVVALTVFLIVSGFLFHYARKIEPVVASRIKETIISSTDSLYSISFSSISINPLTGNVKLGDIRFKANPSVYARLLKRGLNPTHVYEISVKSLYLKKAHPIKAYFDQELHVEALIIDHPKIRMYYQNSRRDSVEVDDNRTAWQRLSKYVRAIHIREILVDEIDFQYIDETTSKTEIDGVKNMSIRIDDILIDSTSHRDKSRFYYTKDVEVRVRDQEFLSRDSAYTIFLKNLKVSSKKRSAQIEGLKLVPRFEDMPLFDGKAKRRIRYSFDLERIEFANVNFKQLIDRRELRASSLDFKNLNVDVFLNKSLPKPIFDRGVNFPHVALKRFGLNTAIDTVRFFNSGIRYSEFNPVTEKKGKLFINFINGSISNFTNDSVILKKDNWARASFSSLLYGKGRLEMDINFNLTSPDAEYNYVGKLGEINPRAFNQVLRPSALMLISSGDIKAAEFSVKADYRRSEGFILLNYSDLKIGILKMNAEKKLRRNTLLSMVANNLLLKEANPLPGESLRRGKIYYSRPDSVAFFSSMWQSLYSGIKETIGMTAERESSLMAQFKGLSRPDKKSREQSRAERKEKRLERLKKRD